MLIGAAEGNPEPMAMSRSTTRRGRAGAAALQLRVARRLAFVGLVVVVADLVAFTPGFEARERSDIVFSALFPDTVTCMAPSGAALRDRAG